MAYQTPRRRGVDLYAALVLGLRASGPANIDSERKPFGREITKSAPIRNIISLEHQRKGILRLILNFGLVRVVVADETLHFYDVGNPALVQQDIYYRQEQLKLQQEEEEREKDEAHFTKWLQAYHEVLQSDFKPPSEES